MHRPLHLALKSVKSWETYWGHIVRGWSPPGRSPQRSAGCWTWARWRRRPQSDRMPAWTALIWSAPGGGRTWECTFQNDERGFLTATQHHQHKHFIFLRLLKTNKLINLTSQRGYRTPGIQRWSPPIGKTLQCGLSRLSHTPDSTVGAKKHHH